MLHEVLLFQNYLQYLVELFWQRNESAIEKTDKKYGKFCFSIAKNIVNLPEDAKECVNDSYFALWNSIPPNRPTTFPAYLAKIVRNVSLKKLRSGLFQKRNCEIESLALDELDQVIGTADELEDTVDARELSKCIDCFVKSLDLNHKTVFVGRYFFGDSIKKIARYSGKSEAAVKMMLVRTRKELREHLIKEGFLDEESGS